MAETTTVLPAELPIHEQPWQDPLTFPPTDLPSDDGERMESSWHASSGPLLKASYIAARGGAMTDFYLVVSIFGAPAPKIETTLIEVFCSAEGAENFLIIDRLRPVI